MKRLMHTLAASFMLVSIVLFNVHPPMAQAAKTDSLPATNPSIDLQSGGSFTNFPLYAANASNSNVVRLDSSANQTLVTSGGNISYSSGLAIDSSGNLYTGDMWSKIVKISPGGVQSVFIATTGSVPYGLACDDNDNLYYADGWRINKVTPAGVQSVFSSNGYLSTPVGLAFDSRGNLYAANYQSATNSVVKITPAGVQSVFTQGGKITNPWALAFDASDNLYVTEFTEVEDASPISSIIKVTPAGVQSVFATGGSLDNPRGLAFDSDGNLYAGNYASYAIVKINTGGVQSVFASGINLASPTGLAFGGEATQVTTTTVGLAPNPAVYGQSVSFTATVTSPSGTPTGKVAFMDDSTTIPGCDQVYLDESGAATCTTAVLAAGTHPIYARYNGYRDYKASTSTSTNLVVAKASTKTKLTASAPNPVIYGNAVTFTASVTSTTGVTPAGSITLTIDTTDFVRTLDANGAATYVTNTLSTGVHTITATYGGSANFLSNPATTITVSVINPAPALTQLLPASAAVGASGFTLGISGSGFIETSQAYWNGAAITTTLVSPTALQAEISASQLAAAGVYSITVQNPLPGGGTSNSLLFSVINPTPVLTQLQPASVTVGASGFTLGISGSGFIPASQTYWNGAAITTTLVNSTSLQAEISASRLAAAGVYSITVQNPLPGGGTSNVLLFSVNNPAPVLTQLQPVSVTVGASGFTLGISGSGFIETSQVYWNGAAITTTLVSSTALQAEISTSQLAAAGVYSITVQNPLPGGGTSNALLFSVNNPAPALTQLQPVSITAGASGFTLVISGSGFIEASQAYWNGAAIDTTLVNATSLQAEISASRLTAAGVYSITVQNPLPGGGTSNTLLFTVNKATSSVALESSADPSRFGETVILTATVSGANGTPSGTVTISGTVGGAVLQMRAIRSQTLVDGKASFTLPALAPGSYDIQVIYSGDDRFATASGSLTQVVSAPKVYIPLLLQNAE